MVGVALVNCSGTSSSESTAARITPSVRSEASIPCTPSRPSELLRWLVDSPALTLECTGFGPNLVSCNYKFASMIVIEDEMFWSRYGGHFAANWEPERLGQTSIPDSTFLCEMITNVAWSNEGLFALLQGLRRLAEIGGNQVNLPSIEWELRS